MNLILSFLLIFLTEWYCTTKKINGEFNFKFLLKFFNKMEEYNTKNITCSEKLI